MIAQRDRPNVLLIVCDTLRPDFISPYGSEIVTPFFDRMAEFGTVFENAYAAGPGSSISHAALFTGQYPSTNGVGGQVDVPEDVPHIAARFQAAGYETFGMPGPSRIGSHWNYDRGFDEYLEKWTDVPSSISLDDLRKGLANPLLLKPMPRELLRRALQGGDEYASYLLDVFAKKTARLDSPWFSFVNVTITHSPYDPPRPYKEDAIPELKRPMIGGLDRFGTERILRPGVSLERMIEAQGPEGFAKLLADDKYLSESELAAVRALYAASVRYLDDQLSGLFDGLDSADTLENTIIVLLADHGEYLGERGLTGHMYLHFDPCLHVPLIVSGPGVSEGRRRSDLVSLVDVFPSLCDLANIEVPAAMDGRSVFGETYRKAVYAENGVRKTPPVYAEYLSEETVERLERGLKSIRTENHFYTLDSAGNERLFDRPEETEIIDPPSDTLTPLRNRVKETLGIEFPPGSQDDEYSRAIEEDLRNLGYLS